VLPPGKRKYTYPMADACSTQLNFGDKRLGGDSVAPSGLYARLCHAFSSLTLNCQANLFKIGK